MTSGQRGSVRALPIHLIDLTASTNGDTAVVALCRTKEDVYRITNRESLVTCIRCRRALAASA